MNKNRLEFEMKERGITVDALCSGIGISRSAFYRMCNGKSEFTLPEINGIIRLLSLSSEVASLIFLEQMCPKRYFCVDGELYCQVQHTLGE